DVLPDARGQHVAQGRSARGLQTQFHEGELAGAEGGHAVDDLALELVVARVAVSRPTHALRDRRLVGQQTFVDAPADLGEQVVAVREVVRGRSRGNGRLPVDRPEGQPAGSLPRQHLDGRIDEYPSPFGIATQLTPLHL